MTLQDKAIDIHGKEYILVKDRVLFFNDKYPKGSIVTELLSQLDSKQVVVKATVEVDGRKYTGHSQAVVGEGHINKTAALENAETSAVGRALAMMGIGVIDSIASVDEIKKATAAVSQVPHAKTIDEYNQGSDPMPLEVTKACPVHGDTVVWKEAGFTKQGKPYPGFWGCTEKVEGKFCKEKLIDKPSDDPFLNDLPI